jgi:carboxyl-terminal processing protease
MNQLSLCRVAGVLATTFIITSCGGGGGSATPTVAYASDEVEFLVNYMNNSYLFYKDIPLTDVTAVTTPEKALDLKRAPQDKFSNIASAAATDALFNDGQVVAFGFNTKLENDAQNDTKYRVTFVQPNSPAQAAGLRRGDAMTAIDGQTIASLRTANLLIDAFGPSEVGIVRKVSIQRGTQTFDMSMTKGLFTLKSASTANLITLANGTKVGYVYYNSFTTPSVAQWRDAITNLKALKATKIIVDLRLNSGGLVNAAAQLGATLLPTSAAAKPFLLLENNDKNSNLNFQFFVPPEPAPFGLSGLFDEVVFLTSPSTCSASEALIVGLKPYINAAKLTQIGDTTCGKPYGFSAPTYKAKRYNIINTRAKNADGFTDYITGLTAQCKVTDLYTLELGDEKETLLAAAINFLNTGTCPVVAIGQTPAEKEIRTTHNLSDYWYLPMHGLARQTGIQ